jgi:hypothetical protein
MEHHISLVHHPGGWPASIRELALLAARILARWPAFPALASHAPRTNTIDRLGSTSHCALPTKMV